MEVLKLITRLKSFWRRGIKMGTYGLNADEIADIFEKLEFESYCEGDFYIETFILGAIKYLNRLKKKGAFIYSDKKKEIKKFVEVLNGD